MKKRILGKLKKYQGYATFLSGKMKNNRTEKVRGVIQVIRGRTMEVI